MKYNKHEPMIQMIESIAHDVGDILFELETSGALTQYQTEIISLAP